MIEQIKAVSNPLTIIAIFAGLSEIASVFAIRFVNPDLQYIFIWFVMGFPTVLVLLFFGTLIFKPKVLYAPSDFKDEANFLKTMNYVSNNLEVIESQVELVKKEIWSSLKTELKIVSEVEQNRISELIDQGFQNISNNIAFTKGVVENIPISKEKRLSKTGSDILQLLITKDKELNMAEIIQNLNLSPVGSGMAVRELLDGRWIIGRKTENRGTVYKHTTKISKVV